jgi:prepilin peptidase CpaA
MLESNTLILQVAFFLFCLLSLTAVICDVWKFIIPNVVSVIIALLFFPTVLLTGLPVDWLSHIGAAVTVFLAGLIAYKFAVLGAGDVKLLTAVSLWAGFEHLLIYLLAVAIIGGVFVLLLMPLRKAILGIMAQIHRSPNEISLPRVLLVDEQIPYGVAIAVAALYLARELPYLGGYLF